MLEAFLEDHFYKALDWVLKQNEFVVETSLVGVVMNGLSHMHGVKVKSEFACSLIRGLGGNLSSSAKTAFAKEVTYCGFFKCQRDCGNDSCLLSLTTSLGSSECDLNYLQGEVFQLCIIALNEQTDDSSLKVLGYIKTIRYLGSAFLNICLWKNRCDLCSLDGWSLLEAKTSDRYFLLKDSIVVGCSQKLPLCYLMPLCVCVAENIF